MCNSPPCMVPAGITLSRIAQVQLEADRNWKNYATKLYHHDSTYSPRVLKTGMTVKMTLLARPGRAPHNSSP